MRFSLGPLHHVTDDGFLWRAFDETAEPANIEAVLHDYFQLNVSLEPLYAEWAAKDRCHGDLSMMFVVFSVTRFHDHYLAICLFLLIHSLYV